MTTDTVIIIPTLPYVHHVWVGRPIKTPEQPLDLVVSTYEGPLPETELVLRNQQDETKTVSIPGKRRDAETVIFDLGKVPEGGYYTTLNFPKASETIHIGQCVVVVPEDLFRRYLSDEGGLPMGASRLESSEETARYVTELVSAELPGLRSISVKCVTGSLFPDELVGRAVGSLCADLAPLEAFDLANVSVKIQSGPEKGGAKTFQEARDEITIWLAATAWDELSDTAKHFFFNDERGFGAHLRFDPELNVQIESIVADRPQWRIRVDAPNKRV